jgi:hypothetical protein
MSRLSNFSRFNHPKNIFVRITVHSAPHCVVFSTLLLPRPS